ncbi:MAG: hypothetical protein ACOYB2_10410 [Limnohabitans sp.]
MAVQMEPSVAQLEQWAAENAYDIEVDAKAGDPSLWTVTLSALRDRRKFAGSAMQNRVHGPSDLIEQAARETYQKALAGAVAKARAWATRREA